MRAFPKGILTILVQELRCSQSNTWFPLVENGSSGYENETPLKEGPEIVGIPGTILPTREIRRGTTRCPGKLKFYLTCFLVMSGDSDVGD